MSTISASSIQADYMKLLVTQLQNQNPLEPLDNNEMASQLAQFSQLQQLESMNTNFEKVLATTEMNYASSLIGKNVFFAAEDVNGNVSITNEIVDKVYKNDDGNIMLLAGDYAINIYDIVAVQNIT